MAIRGVTFDFWNTLVAERPTSGEHRRRAQVELLAVHGIEREPSEIESASAAMRAWFDESWVSNRVVTSADAARRFAGLLGSDDEGLVADLTAAYSSGGDPATLRLAPGIAELLVALSDRDIPVGIICDTGFTPGVTLRSYLAHHGLLRFFRHWSFSDEVGVYKPDGKMFAHAAGGLGIDDPSGLAHVGDLRRTDVGGATAAGWTPVRYRGLADDTDESWPDATIVIDHHDQLLAALGLL